MPKRVVPIGIESVRADEISEEHQVSSVQFAELKVETILVEDLFDKSIRHVGQHRVGVAYGHCRKASRDQMNFFALGDCFKLKKRDDASGDQVQADDHRCHQTNEPDDANYPTVAVQDGNDAVRGCLAT